MNNVLTIVLLFAIAYIMYPKIIIKFNKNVQNISGGEAVRLIREKKVNTNQKI